MIAASLRIMFLTMAAAVALATLPPPALVAQNPQEGDRLATLEARQRALEEELGRLRQELEEISNKANVGRPGRRVSAPLPSQPVSISGLPVLGSSTAGLAIIEYSDFQCPYCRRHFQDTWPLIDRELVQTGKARYFFHHLPLSMIHPQAVGAAQLAECAHQQGRFWDARRLLFENPNETSRLPPQLFAKTLQLDHSLLGPCLSRDAPARVRESQAEAARLGILSTPTFLIGRVESDGGVRVLRRLAGAQPYPLFKAVIDGISGSSTK